MSLGPAEQSAVHPALAEAVARIHHDSQHHRGPELYMLCRATLQRAAELHDTAALVAVALDFARVMDQHGHADEDLAWLFEALEAARLQRWFGAQAELLVTIGRTYYSRANYAQALEAWTDALEVAQRAGDLINWGWSKLGIGQVCDAMASPALAVAVFSELQQALAGLPRQDDGAAMVRRPADLARLARLQMFNQLNLGVNQLRLGDRVAARDAYEAGLAIARQHGHVDEIAEALFRIAEVDFESGRHDRVPAVLAEARRLAEQNAYLWALAQIHHLHARALAHGGDGEAALDALGTAAEIAHRGGLRQAEAMVARRVSEIAEAQGQTQRALDAFRQAERLQAAIDCRQDTRALADLEDLAGLRVSADRMLLMLASHPVLDSGDWPQMRELLCETGRSALGTQAVVYWALAADGLHAEHCAGAPTPDQTLANDLAHELLRRLRDGHPVVAQSARHHQDTWSLQDDYLGPREVQALLACPVQLGGETVGAFFFERSAGGRHWGRETQALANQLVTIASRCLSHLARRRGEQQIRRLNMDLERANQALEQHVESRTAALRQAMVQLEASRSEALRNARAKGEFLAHMSHEIRTPLNGVLGLAQVGHRQSAGDARAHDTFGRIIASGQLLQGVIDDILDFSKIEAGMLRVAAAPLDLPQLLAQCIELVREAARDKGLALELTSAPDLPQRCIGDALRLHQVLMNLLSNAVKFTPSGRVGLSAACEGAQLCLRVADTGVGIASEQLAAIFEPFRQADSSTTRQFGGTGLGLSISRQLAGLMGGRLDVQSQPGQGSCFELRIPLVAATSTGPRPAAAAPGKLAATPLAGLSLLVAEDNEVNQLVVQRMLELCGAQAVIVGDGHAAVERLRAGAPDEFDAVLMDVQMPTMDGYQATRLVRDLLPGLPVIGLTAHALAEDRALCLAAGMVDHLAKPVALDELVRALLRHARH